MACQRLTLPGGGFAIVCGRGVKRSPPCSVEGCNGASAYQCDWPKGRKTCDVHLCEAHACEVSPDLHCCPEHLAL